MKQERIMPVMIAVSIGLHLAILGGAGGEFFFARHRPFSVIRPADDPVPEAMASTLPEITVLGVQPQIPPQEAALPRDEPERPLDAPAAVSVQPSHELLREIHSTDPAEAAMLRYQDTVKQRIEQFRRYPESARQQHREGTIEVVFTVNRDGAAGEIALLRSSASKLL
ncbi:MAG: energy transducer TonB, partial [Candidatus Omnitrophica bacterium]|nr:energy transducer TonB [Candidatus Omnitrophota bacterium]